MRGLLAYVRQHYGSLTAYMTACGFGPEEQAELGSLLTSGEWHGGP